MVSISDCSLTVKNLSFSNIRTEWNLGSFHSSYVNIENLSLKDIRDNGHSLLFIGSKGTVSGLTIERDTSRWAIAKIEQGSKIDFNNLKMSNCTTTDHAGLFITSNSTVSIVNIDTLDIINCNWKSHSISVDNSIFTLDNGNISNITAEGSAGLNAWSCNSLEVSNTTIESSYSAGSNMNFNDIKKVSIKNSSFIANRSVNGGGGIHVNEVDSLFIDNCFFLSDSSDASGTLDLGAGKFYSLKGLIMENNYAADGAGAINLWDNEKVEIIDSKFISNKSVTDGGAIYSWNTDSLFIKNSTFDGNESTDGNGGAITFKGDENSTLYCEIRNTTFENNSGGWGGAIAAFEPIDMNIYSVFATGNKASGNGGFITLCCGASVSITNSTIYNNETNNNDLNGCSDCKMFVTNSIIWKDKIGGPSDATIEITYSDIEGGWDGEGNIDADPHFIDAANGDYHIGDYSPCIGAGVYSAQFDDTWYYAPSTDLDGNPRPNPAGSMPDMGAYENPRATPQHAPEPFELVFPFDSTHIGITRHNYLDTLYFAWNKAIDIDGDAVRYRPILTGDLTRFFLITSNTDTTIWKIPYHHVEHYMHTEGIEFAQGTWTMVASDGGMDTYASNGPFLLTIDASAVTVDNEAVLPESFALHANYPNPFNPSTTISYDLPEQAQVTLGIYDLLGKQIKTLVNQSQDAGKRIAVWDGTDDLGRPVSAGVYLYQIQAGEFSQTRKMLLLK